MTRHRRVTVDVHRDPRGSLLVIDEGSDAEVDLARVYVITDVPGSAVRGGHAHRELHQLLVIVRGSVRVVVDDGVDEAEYVLDQPGDGVFLGSMVWRELHDFSRDAVVLVAASGAYDPDDYIHDREAFHGEILSQIVTIALL